MFKDLRDFISAVDKLGECKIADGADWDLEIGVLSEIEAKRLSPSLLLFDRIKGHEPGFRVVTNLFSTQRRVALAFGLPLEAKGIELVKAMRRKLAENNKLLPPVEVETAPVKENILMGENVDLFKFPAPKWHELDGGRYIGTGTMTITRDPDGGWVNLGCYRVQVHDKTTVTIMIEGGHHGAIISKKYWDRGLACPVAIALGQEPVLWFSATSPVPWGISEYDYAGGLLNTPVEVTRGMTTDLPIPATAEIVLEGEILPPQVGTRMEGPFGEWTGYYASGAKPEPAVAVKCILHRNNPIIQGNPPMLWPSPNGTLLQIHYSAQLWDDLEKQVPGVSGVWQVGEAGIRSLIVISLEQQYPGHAKQAALVAAGSHVSSFFLRYVLVVDEDIDPSNLSEVLWALGTRSEPELIDIVRECWSSQLNPRLPPEKRERGELGHSMAIILACKPYNWIKDFPSSIKTSPEMIKKTKEKWSKLFQ